MNETIIKTVRLDKVLCDMLERDARDRGMSFDRVLGNRLGQSFVTDLVALQNTDNPLKSIPMKRTIRCSLLGIDL